MERCDRSGRGMQLRGLSLALLSQSPKEVPMLVQYRTGSLENSGSGPRKISLSSVLREATKAAPDALPDAEGVAGLIICMYHYCCLRLQYC